MSFDYAHHYWVLSISELCSFALKKVVTYKNLSSNNSIIRITPLSIIPLLKVSHLCPQIKYS